MSLSVRQCLAAGLFLGSVSLPPPAVSQEMATSVDVQFSLFFRVLTYDRNLSHWAPHGVVIGIVFQPQVRASVLAKNAALRQQVPSEAGFTVRMVPIALASIADVAEAAALAGCNALYVTPMRAVDLGEIAAAGRDHGMLTLTGVAEYVPAGIAVGIGVRDDRPEILVNLAAARAAGADFSSQLLLLARVM